LDITNNPNLTQLNCSENSITVLDISGLNDLQYFYGHLNQISILDFTNKPDLIYVSAHHNNLSLIDVSDSPNLQELYCGNNQISVIDLTNQSLLERVFVGYNQLTQLNIRNGGNTLITNFDASNNPNLQCIQVDDQIYSTANWANIDASSSFSEMCPYCVVYIPDANFKAALVANTAINTNLDSEIQCLEAIAVTTMDVSNESISDLTGIEYFTDLNTVNCSSNLLTNLDLTSNVALTNLSAANNQITTLDLTANTNLLSAFLTDNLLSSLNLSGLTQLASLNAASNDIITLDLSTNTALTSVYIAGNLFTSLDLSNNNLLTEIEVQANSLNLLNVANGNNSNVTNFNALFNNLNCIQVDNVGFSNSNWTNKDATAFYSIDCSNGMNGLVFEGLTFYPNPASELIYFDSEIELNNYKIFNSIGELVQTGNFNNNQLNVSNLIKGIYWISIGNEKNQIDNIKFIKE
jgi:hypothetical protein